MSEPDKSYLLGIFFKILHVFMAVAMLSLVRAMNEIPVTEVMFFRAAFAILPIVVWLGLRGELRGVFRTRRPLAHVRRTIIGVTCTGLTFVAVQNLPLPEAVTLQYSQPLFVVTFSAMFLRERVGSFQWGAVVFGFLGVLVVSWPNLTLLSRGADLSQSEIIGVSAALLASAGVAAVLLLIGDLVRTESPGTISTYTWLISTVLLSFTLFTGWEPLTLKQIVILVLTGIFGGLVQLFMAISLKFAPASTTAPIEYTSLIFATAIGFVFFGDMPGINILTGGVMVITAGLVIIWRENRRGKSRKAEARVAPST